MRILDLQDLTISKLAHHIRKKEISPVEVIDSILSRIPGAQEKFNIFITVLDDQARKAARLAEDEIVKGHYRGPLHGIPFAAKDLFFTQGIRTTCGTRILTDFVPEINATVIDRLYKAGAILIGKTNMHEFALGATNLNPHYGDVKNPWNPECVSGGSSGGSAVAVATGCALLALGTDTGGSIRIPAALCGISGIKPTFGRVSKFGVYPLCWSLDHPGPLTRSVADSALALSCIAGYDPKDPSTKDMPVENYSDCFTGDIRNIRVGVPDTIFFKAIDPEVKSGVEAAIAALKQLGAKVVPIHIPDLDAASAATMMILSTEAAACLEKYHRTRPDEIGRDVKSRLDLGSLHLAVSYIKAQRIRRSAQENFARAFMQVDVLVTPGVSIPASRRDKATVRLDDEDIPVGVALTRCTRIFNLVGIPSVSVPVGFTRAGLPIGMQIAGRPFDEATIFKVAEAYERNIYHPIKWPVED